MHLPRTISQSFRQLLAFACLPSLLLANSGCAGYGLGDWYRNSFKVGPEYREPAAPVAVDWIDENDQRVNSNTAQTADWWTVFEDPVLNQLVQSAYQQNLTLREAGQRVLEARANRGIAVGNLFPQSQTLNGEFARTLDSENVANLPPGFNRSFDGWTTSGNVLWEVDLWGRFRRAVESADADLDASVENYDDVLVSLVAEIAATYTNIRTLQKRLEYAVANAELQAGSLKISESQFRNGAVTEVDVQQATINLTTTEALIPDLREALRIQNNLLCFLLGTPPRDMLPELGDGPIPRPPVEVALGIPCELIRRRPDVRLAERNVAAQSALIGVAAADLYPAFSIGGSIGYSAQNLSRLFVPTSNTGLIAPGFSWNLLNYGRIRNNVRAEEAAFQALAVEYQNTVLRANKEVEDGVTQFLYAQDKTLILAETVQATERASELIMSQYKNGAVNFNSVFTIQESQVTQQDNYAASQGDIALGLIAVYKALGGGWEVRLGAGLDSVTIVEPVVVPVPELEEEVLGPQDSLESLPRPEREPLAR